MDSSIVSDPRFKLVGMSLGIRHAEVIGCCYLLWLACYERRSERLSIRLANACADLSGFAEALIAEELCTDCGDGTMIVHGVEERIAFLKKQAERGAKGGKSKKKAKTEANAKQTLVQPLKQNAQTAKAYTLTPSLTPSLTPDKESKCAPKRRATLIPDSWKPNDQHRELASELGVDVDDEAEGFRDYWLSEGKAKKDWDATFRNRLRAAAKRADERRAKQPTRAPERML